MGASQIESSRVAGVAGGGGCSVGVGSGGVAELTGSGGLPGVKLQAAIKIMNSDSDMRRFVQVGMVQRLYSLNTIGC
jgi:hypothetical protein